MGKALPLALDLEIIDNLKLVVDKTLAAFKRIDILINNASLCIPAEVLEVTKEFYDQHFLINLRTPFFWTQYALNSMIVNSDGFNK